MNSGINPVRKLKPRMNKINHATLQTVLADLRSEGSVLDLTPPPMSVTMACTRHANRGRTQQEAKELHAQLDDLLAQSFRPYTELTAH